MEWQAASARQPVSAFFIIGCEFQNGSSRTSHCFLSSQAFLIFFPPYCPECIWLGSELSLWHSETWAGSALTVDLEELIMVLISHTAAICHMLFLGPVTYYELWVKNGVSPQDKMPHLCNK